mmetsp:Transcript_10437/g.24145  ORF Transcript_10437/g.24145 Transcript_10437/m.24145 type:complete len:192 (+) Transcript_10437:56-631(+)
MDEEEQLEQGQLLLHGRSAKVRPWAWMLGLAVTLLLGTMAVVLLARPPPTNLGDTMEAFALGCPGYTSHGSTACIPGHGASILEGEQGRQVSLSVYCAKECDAHKDCVGFLFHDGAKPMSGPSFHQGGKCWLLSGIAKDLARDCLRAFDLQQEAQFYITYIRDGLKEDAYISPAVKLPPKPFPLGVPKAFT